MRLAKRMCKFFSFFIVSLFVFSSAYNQENSPFSRYGFGDVYPQQNIASRGMGGISAAYASQQAINTYNPASYSSVNLVTYDFALSIDARTLLSKTPVSKYQSTNFLPSYLQLGVPLSKPGKLNTAALVFGIRPFTRINYAVLEGGKIPYDSLGVTDSTTALYNGNGGMNQVFFGLGKVWKNKKKPNTNLSLGFNFGYEWGMKYIGSRINFPSDSSYENWYGSNSTDSLHAWGIFFNPGIMASFTLKEGYDPLTNSKSDYVLVVGASGTLAQNLKASKDVTRETFFYKSDGDISAIDSVYRQSDVQGRVKIPYSFNGGFMLNKMLVNGYVKKWGFGVDYSFIPWTQFRNYDQPDQMNDSWFLRAGLEYSPSPIGNKGPLASGLYRVGIYTGKDGQNADGNSYQVQALTLGYSFNLRKYRSYDKQFTMINTAFEFGKRGTNINNVTENFFKFSLGLSLSDIWFIKRKYD